MRMKMILLTVVVILVIAGAVNFLIACKEARERFKTYEVKAQTVSTSYGKISFIDEGAGEPILSFHGICGGYDQAYDTLSDKMGQYRVIAPSRFGYPGSDMPENATIEMQVEAFCEMLDQLDIEKTYLLATSAGSTSAIRFALMHPERTKGLILYCAGYPALEMPVKKVLLAGPPGPVCNDFCMWLISPLFKPIMGMERSTLKSIMPLGKRHDGIVFDGKVTNTVMINAYETYDMRQLTVPVLILHAKDDELAEFSAAEQWAERMEECTFVALETGGHLMTGNSQKIEEALDEFIGKTK